MPRFLLGMLIVIAIGIALGIAAGFLMLGLAVIYFKRSVYMNKNMINNNLFARL